MSYISLRSNYKKRLITKAEYIHYLREIITEFRRSCYDKEYIQIEAKVLQLS